MRAAVLALAAAGGACQSSSDPAPAADPLPADCLDLAEHLASLEIGNYAPELVREAQVARDRAACEAARPTGAQGECIAGASSREAAEACAPGIQLDVGCERVIDKVRAAAQKPAGLDPGLEAQLTRGFAVMETACREDGWPRGLKICIVTTHSMERCVNQFPKELRDRLAARVMDELSPAPR